MINKKREFVYTSTVSSPANLVGEVGDVRTLQMDDAFLLKSQGYGYIESEGPPIKAEPSPVEEDIEVVNARSVVKPEITPPVEDIEITNARKAGPLQPQTVEDDPELDNIGLNVPEPEVTTQEKETKDVKVRNKRKSTSSKK